MGIAATFLACLALNDGVGAAIVIRLPLVSGSSQIVERRHALGDWRLNISRSRFSGEIFCRLRSRSNDVLYVANALGFRFGKHHNVMDAWVKIDGGAPYRWRDDLPELARLGVAIDGRNLDAPTDGIVWIPAAKLSEANRVTIQSRLRRHPRTFLLHGSAGLREIARTMGCEPEARFVR